MTEVERDAVRAQVRAEMEEMKDGLATFFLGRHCPLLKEECRGPECPLFMINQKIEGGKLIVTGGNCVIPLAASQLNPAVNALQQMALAGLRGTDPNLSKVITNGPVLR